MSSTEVSKIEELANKEYKYAFVTDIEGDTVRKGLNKGIIRQLSAKKMNQSLCSNGDLKHSSTG